MPAHKLSISLPDEIAEAVNEAARAEGVGLSAWMASAARTQLRQRLEFEEANASALEMVIEFEAIHGPIPDEAKTWAAAVMADAGFESPDAR